MSARPWPAVVDDWLGPTDEVRCAGPNRWVAGLRRVLRFDDAGAAIVHRDLLREVDQVAPFTAPEVVGTEGAWLVTDGPAGVPADRPDLHPEPGSLAEGIGRGLAALHALPVTPLAPGPIVDPWAAVVDRCRRRVSAGLVDPGHLPTPYDRYPATRLLEMLVEGGSGRSEPGEAAAVLCHGSPTADRFLFDGDRFVGFDGLESVVVADRHLDLAVAHVSVAEVLGAEAVYAIYEGYGADPDLARLDRGILARHLLIPADGGR